MSERTRVLHVSVVHRPDDPRIFERECRSLAEAGYAVACLTPGSPPDPERNGVVRLGLKQRARRQRPLSYPEVLGTVRRWRPHVVHLHDPELLTLVPVLRSLAPRLVYDMHEYVGDSILSKYYLPKRLRPAAARCTLVAQRTLAALCSGVVTVTEDQWRDLGTRPRLRVALANVPRFSRFSELAPIERLSADPRLKLIYVGSLTRNRGVSVMLETMLRADEGVALYFGGTFSNPDYEAEVRSLIAGELAGRVELLGRIAPDDVPNYLASADVVWVPSEVTQQYRRPTMPTKVFESMAAGRAVLVADLPGRAEIVQQEACGLVVPPTIEGGLKGVTQLLGDRDAVAQMGARGRAAVQRRYSWEVAQRALIDFYERLCTALPAQSNASPQ